MTILNNTSAEFVLMSADILLKKGHSFEWNEDRVTVFLKWMDSSDREELLKFESEGQKLAKCLRSLEH